MDKNIEIFDFDLEKPKHSYKKIQNKSDAAGPNANSDWIFCCPHEKHNFH